MDGLRRSCMPGASPKAIVAARSEIPLVRRAWFEVLSVTLQAGIPSDPDRYHVFGVQRHEHAEPVLTAVGEFVRISRRFEHTPGDPAASSDYLSWCASCETP